ncbi:MAG: hypothetical protein J7K77_05165 [Dehalococcoidales bacterium]|nr:hypothetical protein [Dehalococcoidales bacterium]
MKVNRIRLAARIIGFGITGFGGTMLIGEAVGEFQRGGWAVITEASPTDPGVLLVVIGGVALAGCIVSWWREQLAGILLVSVAAAIGAHIGAFAGSHHLLVWTMVGLPYLVAGILFLNCWRLSRQLA